MSKFIIIVYIFLSTIFLSGCKNQEEVIYQNNVIENIVIEEQITENKVSENVIEDEVNTTISNVIAKENITKEETVDKSNNIEKSVEVKETNTKPVNKPVEKEVSKVEKEEEKTISTPIEKPVQVENNSSEEIQEDKVTEEIEKEPVKEVVPQKNGYYYNESESNFLVSEFKRLTNYDSNFTVRISESAKSSNPFYPYRESEINKKVYNATFGYFIVYAEDYYKDDIKQRTLYYITFDN